jgi:Ca2+-dependent lipid-binding protein
MSLGVLTIELIEAHLTHDTAKLGKMDPYVKFKSRDWRAKSAVDKNGGKKPEWKDQKFEIEVKYLGDDLEFIVKDDDNGRDDLIGDGATKLSAFACYEDWDEWFTIEHKGKRAGKIHLKSHWEPKEKKEEASSAGDEMQEIQMMMKEAMMKKKELESKFHDVKEAKEDHAEAGAARIAAAEAEAAAADWDAKAAEAEAKFATDLEAVAAMKAEQEQNKADFEVSIANEVKLAAEVRDCVLNGLDAQEAKAAETRDAALAKAEADKEAGMAEFAAARAAVEAEIEEEKRHDAIAHDHITDEIKEVAEKLLAINAQITEHLTALTNL